jgi:hypothetical protein
LVGEEGVERAWPFYVSGSNNSIFSGSGKAFDSAITNVAQKCSNHLALYRKNLTKSEIHSMVGEEGVEPSRDCSHRCLRPTRIPVPPSAHIFICQVTSLG